MPMKIALLKGYLILSLLLVAASTFNFFILENQVPSATARQLFGISAINILFCYFVIGPRLRLAAAKEISDEENAG